MNTDKEMNTVKEGKPKKKTFAKIAEELPYILMGIGIFLMIFGANYGLSKAVEYKTQVQELTVQNAYLKEEIEWFKEQLADVHYEMPTEMTTTGR